VRHTRRDRLAFHAIYAVLNDATLFECSVRSIYDYVDRITVITGYDRDWHGTAVEPDELVERVLSRDFDPERKIDIIVSPETNEARARNRAMEFALPRRAGHKVRSQHEADRIDPGGDYFWIVDSDEIYERVTIPRLQAVVAERRRASYRAAFRTYFRTWNYRVSGVGFATTFLRRDIRLHAVRNPPTPMLAKLAFRTPGVSYETVHKVGGNLQIPPEVGVFHHGSYVGSDERVVRKATAGGHSDRIVPGWLEDVWRDWSPKSRNFHPTDPNLFESVEFVPTVALPAEIRDYVWPEGYLSEPAVPEVRR
jgi:hypothetical protein